MASQKICDPMLSEQSEACPLRGDWISFQLVNENGDGKSYAGLAYVLSDSTHQQYIGVLDANGSAKVINHYQGPVALTVDSPYEGTETLYSALCQRSGYPLPITELQVRAEKTRFARKDGTRVENNPAKKITLSHFFALKLMTL
ncbi:hypothetical protein [Pseudomonas sp. EA_5y_Pfl2_R50]|uniref:hypothetical protein n=1 Tax=Pseudomonas sp. EA_5y_Pfl2_R50 TaxID=3088691 RepID=UPI0030D76CBC